MASSSQPASPLPASPVPVSSRSNGQSQQQQPVEGDVESKPKPNEQIQQQLPEGDVESIKPTAQGYENVGFEDGESVAPPNVIIIDIQEILKQAENPADILQEYTEDAILSEEEIREIALTWVRSQGCCWGKKFAKKMEIKSVTPYPALRYEISSYCEERKCKWRVVPFRGGLIDGPMNGIPPGPWEIPVQRPGRFKNKTYHKEVPHTCSVHRCFRCHSSGQLMCKNCHGEGAILCVWCFGRGFNSGLYGEIEICWQCRGRGFERCWTCKGSGAIPCFECDGYGRLKTYIELTVRFHSVTNSWIYDRTGLPREDMTRAKGKRIMEQVLPRVSPIQGYKIYELNKASYDLVMRQSKLQEKQFVHYQGQNVEMVPVTQVIVYHGKKREELCIFIFGFERNVVFPDYPQKGCC